MHDWILGVFCLFLYSKFTLSDCGGELEIVTSYDIMKYKIEYPYGKS